MEVELEKLVKGHTRKKFNYDELDEQEFWSKMFEKCPDLVPIDVGESYKVLIASMQGLAMSFCNVIKLPPISHGSEQKF